MRSNGRIAVYHIGNDPSGSGGIATVIRGHLDRNLPGVEASALTSYSQNASSGLRANMPFLRAVRVVLSRACGRSVLHVHVSHRGSLFREGALVWLGRALRMRVVVTLHGSSLSAASRIHLRVARGVIRGATVVHGFTDEYRDLLSVAPDRWIEIPNDTVIPPTVDFERRSSQILFAGDVSLRKGVDLLLDAWKSIDTRGWSLKILGALHDVELGDAVCHAVATGTVDATGQVSSAVVQCEMLNSRILVLPSRAEAFPMAVCEGLACGCAVIGTNVGGMGSLLAEAGQIVVLAGRTDELSRRLSQLMSDTTLASALGRQGRQYAREHLSRSAVAGAWCEAYGVGSGC